MSDVLDLLSSNLDERSIRDIAAHLGTDHAQTEAAIAAALPTLISAMARTVDTEHGSQMMASQIQGIGGGSLGDLLGGLLGSTTKRNAPSSMQSQPPKKPSTEFEEILPPGFEQSAEESPMQRHSAPNRPTPSQSNPSRPSPLDRSLGPGNELPPSYRDSSLDLDVPSGPSPIESMDEVLGKVLGGKQKRVEEAVSKSSGMDLRKIGPLLAILAPLVLSAMKFLASSRSTGSSSGLNPADLSKMMRGERKSIEQKQGGSLIGRMLDQDGDGDFDLSDIIKLVMKFFTSKR